MNPGPELDALVAEKVMGCKVKNNRCGCSFPVKTDYYGTPIGVPPHASNSPIWTLKEYSTSIEAAWEVFTKFKSDEDWAVGRYGDKWCVMPTDDETGEFRVFGKTAPHAICLAALKAVGVNSD